MAMATLEDRARFLLKAAELRAHNMEVRLQMRAQDLARRSAEWALKIESDQIESHLADLAFLESDLDEIRRAQAALEHERAIVAALVEVVGA